MSTFLKYSVLTKYNFKMGTQYLLKYFQNSQYSVLTWVLFLSTRFIPDIDKVVNKVNRINGLIRRKFTHID